MPTNPTSDTAVRTSASRLRLLLVLVPVLLLVSALAPAAASAQGGGPSCTAELTATQDPAVASFTVDCGNSADIEDVELRTSEPGNTRGDSGTECTEANPERFNCRPSNPPASLVQGQFDGDSGDLCASPRLTIDFTVTTESGDVDEIQNVVLQNCDSGGGGGGGSSTNDAEDNQSTPEGGVDSGTGGTAKMAGPGAVLPLAGAALLAMALTGAIVLARRGRGAR